MRNTVRKKLWAALLKKYYTTRPDGIPGNDDTGVMSAWAVFSMIGMYPDCPGEPQYTLFPPVFDSVEINGKYVIRKDQKIKETPYHTPRNLSEIMQITEDSVSKRPSEASAR